MVWALPSSPDSSFTKLSLASSALTTLPSIPQIHSAPSATGPLHMPFPLLGWHARFPFYALNPKSPFRSQLKYRFLKEGFPGLPAQFKRLWWGFHGVTSLFFIALAAFLTNTFTHSWFNLPNRSASPGGQTPDLLHSLLN